MTEQRSKMRKACRTIFPMGFAVSKVENGIVVLNFIDIMDTESDEYEIISSIAMSEEKAKALIESLEVAINGDENDSE